MKQKKSTLIIVFITLIFVVAGILIYKKFVPPVPSSKADYKVQQCLKSTICEGDAPCMANPAAVFCTCMGGTEKIVDTSAGQSGMCVIDGKEIDEWEYFRSFSSQ